MKERLKNLGSSTWRFIRGLTFFMWVIIIVAVWTFLGFQGVWVMTLGGLIYNCMVILLSAIFMIREALVALYVQQGGRMADEVKEQDDRVTKK